MCHLLPSVRSLSFLWHSDALLVLQNGNGDGTLASRLRVTGVLCFEFQQSSFPALCAWCPWSPVYRRLFFFSSILMSNHFLFTSLNPINLFCTSASRFWIFTLLTDTYVYWHRQTSQNNFHSNLWERLFFCSSFVISYVWALPFMEESCVHLQMKSDMPCTQLVTYGWLTFSNIRMHERIKSAFLEAILSSEN